MCRPPRSERPVLLCERPWHRLILPRMTDSIALRAATPSGDSTTASPDRQLLIAAEKIRTYYDSMPSAFIGVTLVACLIAYTLTGVISTSVVSAWLAVVWCLTAARYLLWRRYVRVNPPPPDARRWGIYAAAAYTLSGLTWGIGAIVLYPAGDYSYQVFLLLGTVGVSLGAAFAAISYLPAFYGFMYTSLTLAPVPFFLERDLIHTIPAVMALIYVIVATRFVHNVHRSITESIKLRFENIELIDELRQQKRIAEEASVSKSRFLAAASHDLRQPMHALGLFVQTLQESDLPEADRSVLANVRRSVDAMEDLFNALLDVSKLDAGIITANVATVPLAPIIERVGGQYQSLASDKGLRFSLRRAGIYVRTDPILLERILRNLVCNAVQNTLRGGVLVGMRRRGASVLIEVWDTGPGIPPTQHHDIFREFYQLRNPERDRSKGLGLGLAIVDRLSKLLCHPVALRSAPGKGTMFSVMVPCGDAREYIAGATPDTPSGAFDFRDALVCFVDDELAVQQGMASLMSKWACDVVVAGSGAELLQKLATTDRVPDLVISDYRLRGEENGITVIENVRHEFNACIPAFLITGDTGPERLREAAASGLSILHKPLNPAKLRTLMANLLRHRPPV
jgi:two-component system, sensor histidine kinase